MIKDKQQSISCRQKRRIDELVFTVLSAFDNINKWYICTIVIREMVKYGLIEK